MSKKIEKTYTIETSPVIHRRIERFLAMLHWNSAHGHSGTFAMPLDGDGSDKVSVSPVPQFSDEVSLIAGVGYDVEIAYDGCFSGKDIDRNRDSKWKTGTVPVLLKNGEIVKQ